MSKFSRALLPAMTALSLAAAFPVVYAQSSSVSGTSEANLKETNPKELVPSGPSAGVGARSGDPTERPGNFPSGTSAATSGAGATSGASSAGSPSALPVDTAKDDKAIENLRAAAQSLRESIQRMAQMPAGEKRTEAIRESNEALMQVQAAMAALPSHLLLANANEADYKRAIDKMKQASDRLYKAADALANQPPGKEVNVAVKEVNEALLETNEAMLTGLQMGAGDIANIGSARVTGRPGANNVDLSAGTSSGGSAGSSGSAASGKDSSANVIGPTKANDVGVMDSANSLELRRKADSASNNSSSGANPGK